MKTPEFMGSWSWPERPLGTMRRWAHGDMERKIKWVWAHIGDIIGAREIADRIGETVERVADAVEGRRPLVLWTGGTDSLVVQLVMEQIGEFDYYMTRGRRQLVFEECERHYEENGPETLRIERYPYTLEEMVEWKAVRFMYGADRHWALRVHFPRKTRMQVRALEEGGYDLLVGGARKLDEDMTGRVIVPPYEVEFPDRGSRWCKLHAIYDWKMEEVLAAIAWSRLEMPEFYQWPKGFMTGPDGWWIYTPYVEQERRVWEILYRCSPTSVYKGALRMEEARRCLMRNEGEVTVWVPDGPESGHREAFDEWMETW